MADEQHEQRGGSHCFACSPTNPIGLQIPFEIVGDRCIGRFTPGPHHVGFDNVVHGGLVFTALDDVMANLLYLNGESGMTARAQVRYRQPARIGETMLLSGQITARRGRRVQLEATARRELDDSVICEAEGTFLLDTSKRD
ncbi:MAG: hotdog fold domain-containing protein [Pseudomonadota bacterium]